MADVRQESFDVAIDLDSCDQEPIHIIGSVQPHGALIAADQTTLVVEYATANVARYIGQPIDAILGRTLEAVVGGEAFELLMAADLTPAQPNYLRPWFSSLIDSGSREAHTVEFYAHAHDGKLIIELIDPDDQPTIPWNEDRLRQSIIAQLVQPNAMDELARVSADIVRTVTGFDRVMIYRFAADNHGEVIAESTNRSDSFLGLHYPASDIPEPARRHFLSNIIRNIPDINGQPVAIYMAGGEKADANSSAPLNLTYAKLRGVSPVHIQYLQNMGVRASLSISLTTNNRLWGLIACHHYERRYLSSSRIRFSELLGTTISTLLQSLENTEQLQHSISAERIASAIEWEARSGAPLSDAIVRFVDPLMSLFGAKGVLIQHDGGTTVSGNVPADVPFHLMRGGADNGIALSSNLSAELSLTPEQWQEAAGAAFLELSDDGADYLVLTRPHFVQEIRWAGKPEKIVSSGPDGSPRLSPRGSFAVWSEERVGHSEPYDRRDRESLRIIRRALFAINSFERERAAVLARQAAEEDKARLRHALLEASRTSSLGELASALTHELSQPLFAVSNYVSASKRELENLKVELPPNIEAMMAGAVSDALRAADLVRRLRDFFTGADIHREVQAIEPILRQGVELAMVSSTLPNLQVVYDIDEDSAEVWADHVQISLVILNLVRNSLAAMADVGEPKILIRVSNSGQHVRVAFMDNGCGIAPELEDSLFEPFHRSTTRGMGIGLSLCRSIIEAHFGRIWLEPAGEGAQFVFILPSGRQ